MRFFISHSSKNKDIVLKFSKLLKSTNEKHSVFCSSEKDSIPPGKDFVKWIFKQLDQSDAFIPILSKEYYESKFCMIELGVAYSYYRSKHNTNEEDYIFPFALNPIQKGYALSGTPLVNIQALDITDRDDVLNFITSLPSESGAEVSPATSRKIHKFINEADTILLHQLNILELAKINTFFDGNGVSCEKHEDIVYHGVIDDTVVVNYNMNPYEKTDAKKPEFISVVLGYIDKLDLGRYLELNLNSNFKFTLTSFTNSLKRVFVEFKYSDSNRILEAYEIPVYYGDNEINIPLKDMKSKALKNISEICFVIHPNDIIEDEGMYKISKIRVE